jgi:hypothetical protein
MALGAGSTIGSQVGRGYLYTLDIEPLMGVPCGRLGSSVYQFCTTERTVLTARCADSEPHAETDSKNQKVLPFGEIVINAGKNRILALAEKEIPAEP